MSDPITAWQCIGCGKIDGPQECIGVCTSRKLAFVYEEDYRDSQEQLAQCHKRLEVMANLVRRLAHTTPRNGQWEETYRRLQAEALKLLR